MEYYFEVITDDKSLGHILVKARDIIEAGNIAIEVLSERGYFTPKDEIIEINRTEITYVIE
jgi:hypothetical protein